MNLLLHTHTQTLLLIFSLTEYGLSTINRKEAVGEKNYRQKQILTLVTRSKTPIIVHTQIINDILF